MRDPWPWLAQFVTESLRSAVKYAILLATPQISSKAWAHNGLIGCIYGGTMPLTVDILSRSGLAINNAYQKRIVSHGKEDTRSPVRSKMKR